MISDKSLVNISLAVSVIGILALFLLTLNAAESMEIKDINEKMEGMIVGINGTIKSYSIRNGNVFMVLENKNSSIRVVVFENRAEKIPEVYEFKKGDKIYVNGKIEIYKGELEIVAENAKAL